MVKIILLEKNNEKLFAKRFSEAKNEVAFSDNFSDIKGASDEIFIVSSDDEKSLSLLADTGICVVTCGLSSKDTVTFSSKQEEKAVVSLMRSVKSIYGNEIEPMEVIVSFPSETDDYTVLSYVAALILTEKITVKNNNKIYRL